MSKSQTPCKIKEHVINICHPTFGVVYKIKGNCISSAFWFNDQILKICVY